MIQKKTKIVWLDVVIITLLAAVSIYVVHRVTVKLNYTWNWSVIPKYLFRYDENTGRWTSAVIMQGLYNTIRLSVWATILATVIGLVMGILRTTPKLFNRLIGRTYLELVRNLPPLVLVFIFYYFVSDQIMPALGIEEYVRSLQPETQDILTFFFAPPRFFNAFLSAVATIGIFQGAYITEIVRAGIQSIEKGQWEASYALVLSWAQQMRHIVLPQAIKRLLPPLAGQFISTVKDSAIVSAISIPELTFQGLELMNATGRTIEIWITISLLYLALTLALSLGVYRLEIHFRRSDN
ncbi:MAG: amino acid ABC transporter permease [Deltaproteobacteria bacterium]|nr:amino acid ABC transporter permease [Deltaproteobacteria bacterium]